MHHFRIIRIFFLACLMMLMLQNVESSDISGLTNDIFDSHVNIGSSMSKHEDAEEPIYANTEFHNSHVSQSKHEDHTPLQQESVENFQKQGQSDVTSLSHSQSSWSVDSDFDDDEPVSPPSGGMAAAAASNEITQKSQDKLYPAPMEESAESKLQMIQAIKTSGKFKVKPPSKYSMLKWDISKKLKKLREKAKLRREKQLEKLKSAKKRLIEKGKRVLRRVKAPRKQPKEETE